MKTYKDIYKFPLKQDEHTSWVYDSDGNFVFQFTFYDKDKQGLLLKAINGQETLKNEVLKFSHSGGYIVDSENGIPYILIRGWGNLTGTGAHNLPAEVAANIQDTFAKFIVERLNCRP